MLMRIFFLGDAEPRLVLGSAAALAMKGHDVFHVSPSKNLFPSFAEKIQVEVYEGLRVPINRIDIPVIGEKNLAGREISPQGVSASVLTLLKEVSPDVIVSYPESWMLARSLSKKLYIPLVLYLVGIRALYLFTYLQFFHKYSDILRAPFSCTYNVALSELSDFTIAPKKTVKFLRYFGIRRVAALRPLFARVNFSSERVRRGTNIELPESYVLSIATVSRDRNPEIDLGVFRIVMAIARKTPDVFFVVVGTSISDLTNLGKASALPGNVRLVGKIFDDDLLAVMYRKAKCVLCPIVYPGLSTRVDEALFYKRPIVMTKTTADSYGALVDHENCIVEQDFGKWPAKVLQVMDDSELRKKLEVGAERYYAEVCSPKRHALILEQILNYVVEYAQARKN